MIRHSRSEYDKLFKRANGRLFDLEPERCRQIEVLAVRSLRFVGPRPPMVRALRAALKEAPLDQCKDRCHWTLRRLHAHMLGAGAPPEAFQVAANAYLDGQPDSYERWLTVDVLIRPWGSR